MRKNNIEKNFNVGDIVLIGEKYLGMIKKTESHMGKKCAWCDVLGFEGQILYSFEQLRHVDLRKLLVEE